MIAPSQNSKFHVLAPMQLLDHVSITVTDLARAAPFYEAIMSALGVVKVYARDDAVGFGQRNRPDDDSHTYFSVFRSSAATDMAAFWPSSGVAANR